MLGRERGGISASAVPGCGAWPAQGDDGGARRQARGAGAVRLGAQDGSQAEPSAAHPAAESGASTTAHGAATVRRPRCVSARGT